MLLALLALAQLGDPYMVERPTRAPSTPASSEAGETWRWTALGETIAYLYRFEGVWHAEFTGHHLLPRELIWLGPNSSLLPFDGREAATSWVEERLVAAGFHLVSVPEPPRVYEARNVTITLSDGLGETVELQPASLDGDLFDLPERAEPKPLRLYPPFRQVGGSALARAAQARPGIVQGARSQHVLVDEPLAPKRDRVAQKARKAARRSKKKRGWR